jgi:transcriptional regulator with GAF, ATPase, and Fis domain
MRDVELRQGSDMIGTTQVMQRLRQDIELVARSDFTVLITGETALLAGCFCDVMRRRLGLGPVRIDPDAAMALKQYPWPGNVRELENLLSRITLKAAAGIPRGDPVMIRKSRLGPATFPARPSPLTAWWPPGLMQARQTSISKKRRVSSNGP